jgi:hypothetical protein
METAATIITAAALVALVSGMLTHSVWLTAVGALVLIIGALLVSLHDLRGNRQ